MTWELGPQKSLKLFSDMYKIDPFHEKYTVFYKKSVDVIWVGSQSKKGHLLI